MINNETLYHEIIKESNIEKKRNLILEYIKLIRATSMHKKKLSLEVVRMNNVSKLDYFMTNLYLVGDGLKVIAS